MRGQQTEYPITLEFGKYVSHSGDCTINYSLKSVIEHSGSADFGTSAGKLTLRRPLHKRA